MTQHLRTALRRFVRETNAAVAMEALIITPILAWVFVASFVFFDGFRAYNTSVKATFTVADILSREFDTLYGSDLDGLAAVFQHITRNTEGSAMRTTQISQLEDRYNVDWSYATEGRARLFNANLAAIEERIPLMARGDTILLVETFLPYRTAFNLGIDPLEFTNFTVVRPRFAGRIPFNDGTHPSYCTSACSAGNPGEGP